MAPLPVALLAALFKENIMAASGFTPILIYASGTASNVPLAANLTSSASGAELALNYADGKLYFKNSSGVVTLLAGAGGAGVVAGSNTQIQFNNSGVFGASANLTWSGTVLSTTGLTATGAITLNTTTNNQSYTTTGAGTITISSGTAGSINNMTIGGTTAAAGTFTNLTYTGTLTGSTGVIAIGTNQIYKDSSGNVGIGTSSPGVKLDVAGAIRSTNSNVYAGDGSAFAWGAASTYVGGSSSTNIMTFVTSSSERMRIDSSGNVGIGTSSPGYKLDVQGATASTQLKSTTGTNYVAHFLNNTGGFTYLGVESSAGGSLFTGTAAYEAVFGTVSAYPVGFATGGAERMRIDSSGNVGIGTASGSARLNVNGGTSTSQIRWEVNNAAFTQEVSTNAAANAYVYKTNDALYHVWKLSSAEAMRIDSSGNVGIGTSSPNLSSSSTALTVNTGTAANYSAFELASGGTLNYHINANNSAVYHVAAGTRPWVVYTNGSERMRIDSSGNVGIGTSSPATTPKMTVQGGGANGYGGIRILSDTGFSNGSNYQAYGRRGDGNPSGAFAGGTLLARVNTAPAALISGINLGRVGFGGSYDGTDANIVYGAQITGQASGTYSSTSAATDLVFYTTPSGTAGGTTTGTADFGTERMRIDSSGNVGIGTSSPGYKLDVNGGIRMPNATVFWFNNASGTAQETLQLYSDNNTYLSTPGALILRTNGTTERMRIDASGNVLVTNPAGLGYGTGSGGTVTQATSRTTAVTINKPTGKITMFTATGSPTWSNFTVNNSLFTTTDTVILTVEGGNANTYMLTIVGTAAGSFIIGFATTGGVASDTPRINFAIIKGATA